MAAPIAAAYLVIVSGLIVEYKIVGNVLGGQGIAALGLAGTLCLVLVLSFHAMEIAAQTIIARRYGEGDRPATGHCLDNALFLSFALGVPLTILLGLLGTRLFGADDPVVEALAYDYFVYRLPSIPFLIAILSIIGFFNAIGRPLIPGIVYAVVLGTNALLAWGLVGGNFGMPEMGIRGAGLSQTISSIVGLALFLILLLRPRFRNRFHCLKFKRHLSGTMMKSLMVLAAPVFLQQFLGNFGFYLFMVINGKVADEGVSLAACTIARQIGYLTYLPSLGFGIAAATLVSQSLGAGQPNQARQAGWSCWLMGAGLMVSIGFLFIFFRDGLVDLFLGTPKTEMELATYDQVKTLAASLMIIVGCYQIFESVNTIIGKAIQGSGDTFFVMVVSVGMQWLFFLPLAAYLALYAGYGAKGALAAFAIQLALVATLFMVKFLRGNWMKRVV